MNRSSCPYSLPLPVLLPALLALVALHLDWASLGHFHAGDHGVVLHHHGHTGEHHHEESEPKDAPDESESSDAPSGHFLDSQSLLSSDLHPATVLDSPGGEPEPPQKWADHGPTVQEVFNPSTPRGPPLV